MKLVHCVVTYNRIDYLKKHVSTWDTTRNKKHNWFLMIADDGSTDGSQQFIEGLNIPEVRIIYRFNKRRGVHFQVNQLLRECSCRDFDIGFMAEDDVYFIRSGWNDLYIRAIKVSGFDFLCYFNGDWAKNHGRGQVVREPGIYDIQRSIQSKVHPFNGFGCFWTFTKQIIEKVGYFDSLNFGVWGSGHTDYALRCCRAGFNDESDLYDAYESQNFIGMMPQGGAAFEHGKVWGYS